MGDNDISLVKESIKNSFQNIKKDVDNLNRKIELNSSQISEIKSILDLLVKELKESKKTIVADRLNDEVMSKVKRNRRGMIKSKMIELIETERYSIPEIKESIVDRDRYCSKATFYRYISEMKESISEVKIGSKIIAVPARAEFR